MTRSAANALYLVTYSEWEVHEVISAWTDKQAAQADCDRVAQKHKRASTGEFSVEEYPLNKECSDGSW